MTDLSSNRTPDIFVLRVGREGKTRCVREGPQEVSLLRGPPTAPLTCKTLLFLSLPELGETDTVREHYPPLPHIPTQSHDIISSREQSLA